MAIFEIIGLVVLCVLTGVNVWLHEVVRHRLAKQDQAIGEQANGLLRTDERVEEAEKLLTEYGNAISELEQRNTLQSAETISLGGH